MSRTRTAGLVRCVALAAALGASAAPATAATAPLTPPRQRCVPQRGTITRANVGRVWHRGTSLYGCTERFGRAPRTRRLGPWTAATKVAFDGVHVAWTVRTTVLNRRTDRVWAAALDFGVRWMLAQKPNPGGADRAARETLVRRIVVRDTGVAWVTAGGDVVGALREPDRPPVVIGTLPAPPVVQRNLVLVGSWPEVPLGPLAASLRLREGFGDGDECGGVNPYRLTVVPDPAAGEAGVSWDGIWSRPDCG